MEIMLYIVVVHLFNKILIFAFHTTRTLFSVFFNFIFNNAQAHCFIYDRKSMTFMKLCFWFLFLFLFSTIVTINWHMIFDFFVIFHFSLNFIDFNFNYVLNIWNLYVCMDECMLWLSISFSVSISLSTYTPNMYMKSSHPKNQNNTFETICLCIVIFIGLICLHRYTFICSNKIPFALSQQKIYFFFIVVFRLFDFRF